MKLSELRPKQQAAWTEISEYLKNNAGVSVANALEVTGHSSANYYSARRNLGKDTGRRAAKRGKCKRRPKMEILPIDMGPMNHDLEKYKQAIKAMAELL